MAKDSLAVDFIGAGGRGRGEWTQAARGLLQFPEAHDDEMRWWILPAEGIVEACASR